MGIELLVFVQPPCLAQDAGSSRFAGWFLVENKGMYSMGIIFPSSLLRTSKFGVYCLGFRAFELRVAGAARAT